MKKSFHTSELLHRLLLNELHLGVAALKIGRCVPASLHRMKESHLWVAASTKGFASIYALLHRYTAGYPIQDPLRTGQYYRSYLGTARIPA